MDTQLRILLIRLSALGDVVHCLPALALLRASAPGAEIGWLVEDRNRGVLDGHPQIDRIFEFRRRGGAGGVLAAAKAVRRWRPEVAIDFQGNLKSATFLRLSGARRRIGLPSGEAREGAHLFASETPPPGPPREHRSARAIRLVQQFLPIDLEDPFIKRIGPALAPVPDAARDRVRGALASGGVGRYALLVPGTSEFGAFKRWPAERFGALAKRLRAERGLAPLVTYGPGQKPLADAVVAASGGAAQLAPETKDLKELQALIEGAAVVLGADSGPVAIAAVAGVPTVVLFGPKDPKVYAPPGRRVSVVWKAVYCSPCVLRRCADPICMTTLEVDEAWAGIVRLGETA